MAEERTCGPGRSSIAQAAGGSAAGRPQLPVPTGAGPGKRARRIDGLCSFSPSQGSGRTAAGQSEAGGRSVVSITVARRPGYAGVPMRTRHLTLGQNDPFMRLVIATCTVDYEGRLSAHLPRASRLLMVKADGSVSVHSDGGAYKPLNWMSPPCQLRTESGVWTVTNAKGETLTITIDEVHWEVDHDLGLDPGLEKDGVEAHLQQLLAANPQVLAEGMRLIRREYPTDIGPVISCAAMPRVGWWRSRSNGAGKSTGSSSWPDISNGSSATAVYARCEGCLPPSRSSRRRKYWPPLGGSSASRSTTTSCGAPSRRVSPSSRHPFDFSRRGKHTN